MLKFAELIYKIELFDLLCQAEKVHGPYRRQDGRQIVIIKQDNGKSRTVSYPKFIMEQHLGRILDPDLESVDHLDFDFNNNDISNLRLVPRDQHSADDTRRVKLIDLECDMCGEKFQRSPRIIRDKAKKGNTGKFCSRKCSGKYSRKLQLKQMDKLPAQEFIASEYYRRKNLDKNIKAFNIDYLIEKYGEDI